jgi:hypothetical protein
LAIFIYKFFGFELNQRKIGLPATYCIAVPEFITPVSRKQTQNARFQSFNRKNWVFLEFLVKGGGGVMPKMIEGSHAHRYAVIIFF